MVRLFRFSLILLLFGLVGCNDEAVPPLRHDAYVWQRQWTPALAESLRQSSDVMDGWRVLAGYSAADGRLHATSPDFAVLRDSHKPVIAVIRLDGPLSHWDQGALLGQIQEINRQWQGQSLRLVGLEMDHDSATARLAEYSRFLARLHASLPMGQALSVTGLPTWLSSSDLEGLLLQADEFILQLHGFSPAEQGLFDPRQAVRATRALAERSDKPFRVALPAYGVRVGRGEDGAGLSVEAERPLLAGGGQGEEVIVEPKDVSAVLRDFEQDRPRNLTGVVWFRLPTGDDRRAWSLDGLRSVIQGRSQDSAIMPRVQAGSSAGMVVLSLDNPALVDSVLPLRLDLPATCRLGDGANGYRYQPEGMVPALMRERRGLLPSRHRLIVGWARCALNEGDVHVTP